MTALRILVAIDLTPACAAVFSRAVLLAKKTGAELLVAHVYRPPNVALAEAVAPGVYEEWDENLRMEVARRLDPLVENARRQLVRARALVLAGLPRKALLAAAAENGTDLIVIGARRQRGLAKLFHRNLASRIASAALCEVVTVLPGEPLARMLFFDPRRSAVQERNAKV